LCEKANFRATGVAFVEEWVHGPRPDDVRDPGRRHAVIGLFTPVVYPINRRAWEDEATAEDVVQVVRHAEKLGFDFVTCGDHGALAADELAAYGTARFFDPVATLAYLAAATGTIRLATFVYQVHLRSPLITAKALATIDALSGGRLIAGFGVGSRSVEARAAGVPFESRGAIAEEYLEAVLALWSGEAVSRHGTFVEFDDLICEPRPRQQPRPLVWVAGTRLVSVRRAARLADAWALAPWTFEPDSAAAMLRRARATPEFEARTAPLRVVVTIAPLGGRAARGQESTPLGPLDRHSAEQAVDLTGRWRDAGATDFVLDIPAESRAQLEDAMAWCRELAIGWEAR
jgi:probable F420-dependent oxidoreductase